MVYLEYEKTKLPVLDGYNITKSSQEIAYSDFKCDFTGRTADELPQKYEEVKVIEERELNTITQEPIKKTIENSKDITFKSNVDSDIEITKIKGNHYQDSRDGKNLLDFKETNSNITESGLSYKKNSDGSIEVKGTTNRALDYSMTNKYTFKVGKTYTLKAISSSQKPPTFYFKFNSTNGGTKNVLYNSKTTITIKEEETLALMWSQGSNATLDFKAYIMIYEGTDDKPYEQYGVSPSIDYPSEIKTVGSNVNLLPTTTDGWEQGTIDNGASEDNTTRIRTKDYCPIQHCEYTLWLSNSDNYVFRNIFYYDSDKKYINNQFVLDGSKQATFTNLTFTPPTTAKYCKVVIARKDNTTLTTDSIVDIKAKLEKGTVATQYSPYNQGCVKIKISNNDNTQTQTVTIPIQQEMLEGDYIDKDGEHHEWGKLVLTGEEKLSFFIQGDYILFQYNKSQDMLKKSKMICNYFIYKPNWNISNESVYYGGRSSNYFQIKILSSRLSEATLQGVQNYLKSLYDAGTPVIIYYKLATQINLPLTDEQKFLNELRSQEGINYITAETNISVKYTEDMIPKKAKRTKQNLLCYGYVDNYAFPELREQNSDIDISFTLLSPSKMSTLRTCTAVGTYKLKDLLEKIILKPLLDDGFILVELNVSDISVTVNFLCKTVDYCLNNLSNKFNIWCNIDEQKKIYIKDIELIWNEGKIKHIYDDEHSIKGLQYIKPSTSSDDYANVINFTNVRIYESSTLEFSDDDTKTMVQGFNPLISRQISSTKNGDQIAFEIPIDIKKENILKSVYSRGESDVNVAALRFGGIYTDNTIFNVDVSYDKENDVVVLSDNLGFENGEGKDKEFLLVRDSFFSNLVIGIKYNGSKTLKAIEYMNSDSALVWSINKFYNNKAINEQKNKISKTGIIETTLDMKESWKTVQELREIGTTYMNKNGLKLGGQVELKTDEDVFKVGDTIKINKMIISGVYVVTDIQIECSNNDLEYIVTCKNANMLSSFIDIFRSEDTQETSDKTYHLYLTHYNQEEFAESHEVIQE